MSHIETMEDELDKLIGRTRDRSSVYEVKNRAEGAGKGMRNAAGFGGSFGNVTRGAGSEFLRREQLKARNRAAEVRARANSTVSEQRAAAVKNRQVPGEGRKRGRGLLFLYLILILLFYMMQNPRMIPVGGRRFLAQHPVLLRALMQITRNPSILMVLFVLLFLSVILPAISRRRRG